MSPRGVRRLTRPVYADIITDPESYEGFDTIRVGHAATSRCVREVQTTARRLAAGIPETEHTAVVVEEESGEMVSFCTIRRNPMLEQFYPEVDITAFGRDLAYRGVRLRDGTTTTGEIAIIAALDAIALSFEGANSPEVWARVLTDNTSSHAIFDRLQFLHLKGLVHPGPVPGVFLREDQELRIQHANKPLRWLLDPEVYVPPEKPSGSFLVPVDHTKQFPSLQLGRNDLCICGSGKKWKRCCENGPAHVVSNQAQAA